MFIYKFYLNLYKYFYICTKVYMNNNLARNIFIVIIIGFTLLIPFSSMLNITYALNNNNEYYFSQPQLSEESNNYEKDKKYYYHYPIENDNNDLEDEIQKCEECFFSEFEKLDKKTTGKILDALDKKFGDITKLCRLISEGKIDAEILEKILYSILFNLDNYNSQYNKEKDGHKNGQDRYEIENEYNYQGKGERNVYDTAYSYNYDVDYTDNYNDNYNDYDKIYDNNDNQNYENLYKSYDHLEYGKEINENFIQNVISCLFPIIYLVWFDNTLGNFEIFISKSTDGGETFSPPVNISNNAGPSVEPSIAVKGNNVSVVWDDATSGNFDILLSKSTDGGETFSPPENISENVGFFAAPKIAADGNNLYVVWSNATSGFDEIFISKSTDGGETFSPPENISESNSFSYLPSIRLSGDSVYVVWSDDPSGKRDVFISKSTDGGETFSPPNKISYGVEYSYQSAFAVSDDNVYVIWIVETLNNNDVFISKSTDGGETFSPPENISENEGYSTANSLDSSNLIEPSITVSNNNIYVTWHDASSGNYEILLVTSTDGGETFSPPENISENAGTSRQPTVILSQ